MVKPTAFEQEIAGIDRHLDELKHVAAADAEKATKLAYRLYHRASLTGRYSDFEGVQTLLDELIERRGAREDLCLLRANLHFKWHRHRGVKQDFELCPKLAERAEGRALKADLDFQEGRYAAARSEYEALINDERTWDNLARLAHYWAKMGEVDLADRLFIEAEDELTAKDMRSFAWVELQRGLLSISRGDAAGALTHYRTAERAYNGFWFIDEHIAEAVAMLGDIEAGLALYQSVLERTGRPEVHQALGALCWFAGKREQAEEHRRLALAAFLASVNAGEVHYYHHLAELYSNALRNGPEAVRWAEADLAERENFATQGAFAWALYRCERFREAAEWSKRALSSGVQDFELFHQAAHIQKALGNGDAADALNHRAHAINPHHHGFHIHH